jgi:hypothetical protein
MGSLFQRLQELWKRKTSNKNEASKWRYVSESGSEFTPVEVVENESIDAFREYLSEKKDYLAAFQSDAKRAHREISKAARRRVAK